MAVVVEDGAVTVWVDGAKVEASISDSVEFPVESSQPGVEFGGGDGGGRIEQVAVMGVDGEETGGGCRKGTGDGGGAGTGTGAGPSSRQAGGERSDADVGGFPTLPGGIYDLLYDVEEVLEGNYGGGKILVRHWAMMDEKPVPGWPREIGKSYELEVEEWAAHPELTGARVMETGIFTADLIVYYDVATPGK